MSNSRLNKITFEEFMVAFNAMKEFHKNGNDPLPEIKDVSKIQDALHYPFQSLFGKTLYWGFYKKASCYFYVFAKGHILGNGNKRSGVLASTLFFKINNRICYLSNDEMYDLSKYIANSKSDDKEEVINYISSIFKQHKNG